MKDYRYVVSNLKIEDDVYKALMDDALNDIAVKTNFFKKSFFFDVTMTTGELDFAKMAFLAENDISANTLSVPANATTSGIKMKSFLSVVDILRDSTNIGTIKFNKGTSALNDEFRLVTNSYGLYIGQIPDKQGIFKRYLCIYSYVPRVDFITGADEAVISGALTAKLKLDAFTMYYEPTDTNYLAVLKKNYEYELNKIKDLVQFNSIEQRKDNFKGLL